MPDQPDAATLEAAHMAVLQMFGAVCAEPDNPAVAEQADQSLWRLDELLAAAASS